MVNYGTRQCSRRGCEEVLEDWEDSEDDICMACLAEDSFFESADRYYER